MRAWDAYDAYLFDIDGTLIHCRDAVHYFGFCEVLSAAAGRPMNLDGVVAHGNVDAGILRDAMRRAGIEDSQWRPGLLQMQESLGEFVERRSGDLCVDVLDGVDSALRHLRARGAVLGVATGNLERIGWVKLERAGLRDYFDFGGFSDGYEYRADVIRGAAIKARQHASQDSSICVVGDTPDDIRGARANGLNVIAVATGIFSYDELLAERPDMLAHSLAELAGDSADDSV